MKRKASKFTNRGNGKDIISKVAGSLIALLSFMVTF